MSIDVAAARAEPLADGGRQFGGDRPPVAGEDDGGIRDWGLGIRGMDE